MFEKATREKIRFPYRGQISVEDLWDLHVTELDSVFKVLNSKLKVVKEESLLDAKTKEDDILDLQITIVKHIVEIKLKEEDARKNMKKLKEQKQKILEIMSNKQDASLQDKSPEELQKMLDKLG